MNVATVINHPRMPTLNFSKHGPIWRWVLALLAAVIFGSANVNASSVPAPIVRVEVTSVISQVVSSPSYFASANRSPYIFVASIERFGGSSGSNGDIYFGIVTPGQAKVLTWVVTEGTPVFTEGLAPLVQGIDLTETSAFNVSSVFGRDIEYAWTGQEPAGVYLVFALLVVSGTDPADARNWIGMDMVPLVFQPN